VVNYIPARITAVLIAILFFSKKALFNFINMEKNMKVSMQDYLYQL
jgi:cobalamin biosynthesis protein CobD/CbiB